MLFWLCGPGAYPEDSCDRFWLPSHTANCAKSHQQAATKAVLAAVDICIESLSLVEFIPGRRFEKSTVARSGTGLKVGESGTSTTDDRSI